MIKKRQIRYRGNKGINLHPHQKISALFHPKPIFLELVAGILNLSTFFGSAGVRVEFPVLPADEIVSGDQPWPSFSYLQLPHPLYYNK